MKRQDFSYWMDGEEWNITIPAKDEADGRRRLSTAAIGSYNGVLIARVPAFHGCDWIVALLCRVRNFLARRT